MRDAGSAGPGLPARARRRGRAPWCYSYASNRSKNPNILSIHPALLTLGISVVEDAIPGGTGKAMFFMNTFLTIVKDLKRHRTLLKAQDPKALVSPWDMDVRAQLTMCVRYLRDCGGLALSTGNCYRRLLTEVAAIVAKLRDPAAVKGARDAEEVAFEKLIAAIKHVQNTMINRATREIILRASRRIQRGDVVLTYGASRLVHGAIIEAKGRIEREMLQDAATGAHIALKTPPFEVIVLDARPRQQAYVLAESLAREGIPVTYALHTALLQLFPRVTKVLSSAFAMLVNGSLMARAGTALVASVAKAHSTPFIVLCETLKFSDRAHLDSLSFNVLFDPDETLNACTCDGLGDTRSRGIEAFGAFGAFARRSAVAQSLRPGAGAAKAQERGQRPPYQVCNLAYDVTPASLITVIITDSADIPPTSVPAIVRQRDEAYHKGRE